MSKVIVIGSQKGGVGKTTTTLNLAYSLCSMGKKVLAIDLDSQANLSIRFAMNDGRFNDTKCENTSHKMIRSWSEINWTKAYDYVNRLQIRIVKATKEGKWNLVKRLQYLLTHSFYAKAIAVKKVTQNITTS